MNTLVHFGAPKKILIDGKPHLGTDKLIPLLRNFRQHLQRLGVSCFFELKTYAYVRINFPSILHVSVFCILCFLFQCIRLLSSLEQG